MKVLVIKKCSDPLLWYAGLIGQQVPLLRVETEGYLSREPTGYTNIVRKEDAEIINGDEPCR